MNADLLKGHLDLMLLSLIAAEPGHGYAVIERLRGRSAGTFDLPEGTVYPALHRLEQAGLLASHWQSEAGRRRRVYELTSAGRESLRARHGEWRSFVRAVGQVVGGAA